MPAPDHISSGTRPAGRRRGSVLIVALLLMALVALGVGSYLSLNLSASRLSRQSYQQNAAFHIAEAGAEEALWSFNQANAHNREAWEGWTVQAPAAWRKFTGFELGGNTMGSVKVYVDNINPTGNARPQVVALAAVESPGTPVNTRMLHVTLGRRSYFTSGIVARETLRFAGLNTSVDSWNSDPDNDPSTKPVPYSSEVRNDQGSIATMALQSSAMLVNQANVWGYVATGGAAPEVGVHGSIRGASTPADVQIDPARVSTGFSADLPTVTAPSDGTFIARVGDTLGIEGRITKWRCPAIALRGNQTLTILGDVTLILTAATGSALDVTGNASILVPEHSSLTVYAESDVLIAGNGLGNANIRPISCRIWGTGAANSGQRLQIAGNGALKAVVYAPNAEVSINGNGDVMGAIVGRTITFTGEASFHYDESLANYGDNTPFRVVRWRELNSADERSGWRDVFANW
ncbi:MAG: hypothetical protein HYV75_06760 [Opitutae bacterium]|nr:hypothetical protein [Opitutae bacterium]